MSELGTAFSTADHGSSSTLGREPVTSAGELLLLDEQFLACGRPLSPGDTIGGVFIVGLLPCLAFGSACVEEGPEG